MSRILTDVDGVLLHWRTGLEQFLQHHFDDFPESPGEDAYLKIEEWLGIEADEAEALIYQYHNSKYFRELPAFTDAIHIVNQLADEGHEFIAITACGKGDTIMDNRRVNLEYYYPGVFDTIHLVDYGGSKKNILSQYDPTLWIEDSANNAKEGASLGHTSFVINRENRHGHDEQYYLVSSWNDIHQYIQKNTNNH